jgi:anti-sigma B factor antagonist
MDVMDFSTFPDNPAVALATLRGHITGGPQAVEFTTNLNKLSAAGVKRLIVELSGISLINSSGLGMLVGGLTTMRKAGGSMHFVAVPPNVMNLLEITRLSTVFDLCDTVEDALQKIG